MTIHDGSTDAAAPGLPALLIVDADAQARAATEGRWLAASGLTTGC